MTTILVGLAILVVAAATYRAWRRLRYFLHVFQLEGYKSGEFAGWLSGRGRSTVAGLNHVMGIIVLVGFTVVVEPLGLRWSAIALLVVWLTLFGSARHYRSDEIKKPLIYTSRMQRLIGVAVALSIVLGSIGGFLMYRPMSGGILASVLTGVLAIDALAALTVFLGGLLTRPIETAIQEGFKRSARRKLAARNDLTIVGITGSYGKTSVKFAIAEILSQRFNVLATPGSYNTPMGICKVINNDLRAAHQHLILEMGARYPGDIKELCEIAQPDVAVLTSIGVAHLETMGSTESIIQTKAELVEHMKRGGPVVANYDDPGVMRIARAAHGQVVTVSIESSDADITASDVSYGVDGCRFVVTTGSEREEMHSALLGAHNVTNILLGVGIGQLFGLRLRQMRHAVARLRPVPHRLELRTEGPITVIDDAFNSNPVGARNAVEILGRFATGKRVIVTPGMVEIGERQDRENHELGRFMADHVDLVVLVGRRQTEPIREGLISAGFSEEGIVVCRSFFEAQDLLRGRLAPGDVVLYENDLPDQYDEPE